MTTLKQKETIHFDYLYNRVKEDTFKKKRLIELFHKWKDQQLTIGFTGHFSAGKSTMINSIIQDDLLPSSPIPTSANIVKIKKGKEKVIFHLNDGNYAVQNNIEIDYVKQLSKNGEDVHSLTIHKPLSFLDDDVILMDTPGIDSSDDLEFKRTLDQVHLIDYFIYVMDYNHVQSEVNFNFLLELTKRQVPYMIVVNQIDKHNEREINFASYRQSLRKSIESWELNPEHIFFTSLKEEEHPLNQFNPFIQAIKNLMTEKDHYIEKRLHDELSLIITEHIDDLYESVEDDSAHHFKLKHDIDHVKQQIKELQLEMDHLTSSINHDITKLLNNAYLMDFDTRELAKAYLESRQPNFKVGGLFSKKKTAEEKSERANQFLTVINERIKTEMIWHIRELLLQKLKEYNIEHNLLLDQIQSLHFQINENDIERLNHQQANVTGDYVLVYSNQFHAHTVQLIKNSLVDLIEQLTNHIKANLNIKIESLDQKHVQLNKELHTFNPVETLLTEKENERKQLFHETFNNEFVYSEVSKQLDVELKQNKEVPIESLLTRDNFNTTVTENNDVETKSFPIQQIEALANQYVEKMTSIDLLKPFKETIEKRLEQMNKLHFTVALFGAFSAGKSSFANAWIGEDILPSSPNPTTAAINRILPVDNDNKHRDIIIQFKSEETLVYQLQQLIQPYTDETFKQVDEVYAFVKKRMNFLNDVMSQTESSFLRAFLTGFDQMKSSIDTELKATLDDLKKYVSVEHISSFVDRIDIFYDCDLTRKGITLVDTPGADSIHSRHTNVAMHYVKHSDLIIYVNYYHHAFSRADREFLIQLGQVKDAFSLDKMLFVLNAADLAKTEDELHLVENYLKDQLNQYGIQDPAIYPISSKQLMNNQQLKETTYRAFFDRFNRFIEEDAKVVLATGLMNDIDQLTSFLNESIQEAKEDKEEQQQLIASNRAELSKLETWLNQFNRKPHLQTIVQEIEQLIHYLNERMMIQFLDLMKEAINPATIQSNGRKGKEELKIAIKQLIALLKEKLTMEFQTLEILLDNQLHEAVLSVTKDVNRHIESNTRFTNMYYEKGPIPSVERGSRFDNSIDDTQIETYLTFFKNKKEFFERNKVSELFDELRLNFANYIEKEVNDFKIIFEKHYNEQFNSQLNQLFNQYTSHNNMLIEAKAQLFTNKQIVRHFENIAQLRNNVNFHR